VSKRKRVQPFTQRLRHFRGCMRRPSAEGHQPARDGKQTLTRWLISEEESAALERVYAR
jgi:hypothetical protein